MSNSHETIADIAAEKRRIAKEIRDHASNGDYWDKKRANETAEDLEEEADRLEAALKREKAEWVNANVGLAKLVDIENIGDAAKLREALLRCAAIAHFPEVRDYQSIKDMRKIIKHTLAAPPRNCDVGTAEEQIARFDAECLAIRKRNTVEPCAGCPCSSNGEGTEDCQLRWAQMPYEEGDAE